jgi:tetratricopeptide (TPR) repeat protein
LFFAVRRVVEALASRTPAVLIFEDLHWAEPSELDLLEYLVSHVRDEPVAFLALSRPELLDTHPAFGGGFLAQTTIPLEPLSAPEAATVAAATLGDGPGLESTIPALVDVSGGNPLFVEELAASLLEGAQGGGALPTTVREAIAARIDILPPDERAVLLDASVIGRTFWRGVLRSIGTVDDLDPMLDALEARDLIRLEPHSEVEGDREFSFKHVLIRDVAYATLPRVVRRDRHADVASFVEADAGDHIRDVAWILAHHWREAGDTTKAVKYLVLAAERALEAMAKDEAIRLYDDAVRLVEDPVLRRRVRLQRALSLIELTDFEAGTADIDELLPDLDGPDRIDALLARARASIWLEQFDIGFGAGETARDLAEAAGDAERAAAALGYLAGLETLRGRLDESILAGEEAFRRWVPGARRRDLAVANEFLADSYYWRGDYERAEELARQAYEIGTTGHSIEGLLRGGGWQGVSLAALGRTEQALELLDRLIDTAERIGRPRFGAAELNYSALPLRDLFLIAESRARNEQALEIVRREGEWGMPGMEGEIDLLLADLMEGKVGRADREWPRLWEEAINGASWRPWLGGTRLAYVRAELARHAEGPEATIGFATDAFERARACGRRKYVALAQATRGSALIEVGRAEDGIGQLRAAVEGADALKTPTLRWQHRAAFARALYMTGDDDGAETAYREAAEVISSYASGLTEAHAAHFLDAEPVRDVLKAANRG